MTTWRMCDHQDRIHYTGGHLKWPCRCKRTTADLVAQNPFLCMCMIPPTDVMHQLVYLIDCTREKSKYTHSHQRAVLNCRRVPLASLDVDQFPEHSDPSGCQV